MKILFPQKQKGAAFTADNANEVKTVVNSHDDAIAGLQGSLVDGIAYNATAPTPGKTCEYEFTTAGTCTWITAGATAVKIGDRVIVKFTAPSTYSYIYVNVNVSSQLLGIGYLFDYSTLTTDEKTVLPFVKNIIFRGITESYKLIAVINTESFNYRTIWANSSNNQTTINFGSNIPVISAPLGTGTVEICIDWNGLGSLQFNTSSWSASNLLVSKRCYQKNNVLTDKVNTFTVSPIVPAPTLNYHAGTKKYTDDNINKIVQVGKNLFDKTKATDGYYVASNGNLAVAGTYSASDYIPILANTAYRVSGTNNDYRACYDVNNIFISGSNNNTENGGYGFTSPSNAAFVRITMLTSYKNTAQLELGTVATTYAAFTISVFESIIPQTIARKTDIDTTSLPAIQGVIFNKKSDLQSYLATIVGFMYTSGNLATTSGFSIRSYSVADLKNVKLQLLSNAASGANAYSFYSVTTGFSSANYISGMSFTNFIAAGLTVDVVVPAGALTLLICESDAKIDGFSVTDISIDLTNNKIDSLTTNKIICWGDSITAGTTTPSYPYWLLYLLGSNYAVENLGSGSAWMQDISARQGGVPALLLSDLAIPADTSDVIIPSEGIYNKYQSSGFQLAPKFNLSNSQKAYSPVMIDNVAFNMTLTDPGSGYVAAVKLNRIEAGVAFTVKAGTPIYPNSFSIYRNVLASIFYMGTNNTQSCTLDLVAYTDTIIAYHNDCINSLNNKNYLVLGILGIGSRIYNRDLNSLSSPTNAELLTQNIGYELKMANEYGLRFINLRLLLSDAKAVSDAVSLGYMTQATAETNATNDALWQGRGAAAYSFMNYSGGTDFTHPNAVGYKMIAWYVLNALKKLGL